MAISWYDSTWEVTAYLNVPNPLGEVSITSPSVTFTMPTIQAKMTGTSYLTSPLYIGIGLEYTYGQGWSTYGKGLYLKNGSTVLKHFRLRTGSVAKGSYGNVSYDSSLGDSVSVTLYATNFFNSSNSTTRSVNLSLVAPNGCIADGYEVSTQGSNYATNTSDKTLSTIKLTLNVPPTATVSAVSFDTPYVYAGLTTASVSISSLSAKYGGTISDVTLTIGNQTASRSDNGTLSILLNEVGTFTPTVTVTDSRGQVKEYQLDPITVGIYSTPTVNFDAQRTTNTGVLDDEGAYATIVTTLTFDTIAEAVAPTVAVADEDGITQTATTTWYSSRASDGTLSGVISNSDWSTVASGSTVYGLISITGDFDTQKSYVISLTPQDSEGITGDTKTDTLQTAFYTVDFLAGGHGIAFGMPASQDGFFCNMPANFVDANDVMRALFDFVYPVGSYYETSDTTFDPNVTWGGTWSLETEGQVHISAGANYTVSGALTDTTDGGASTVTLNTTQIPSHSHRPHNGSAYAFVETDTGATITRASTAGSSNANFVRSSASFYKHDTTNSVGGGQAHNNMQPYIIVNRWHRTA